MNWKLIVVVVFCGLLALGGIWYATKNPDQVKPPAPVEEGAK